MIEKAKGIVQDIINDNIRTLVSYGIGFHERMFCDFPRDIWPKSSPPQKLQKIELIWKSEEDEYPKIEVLPLEEKNIYKTKNLFLREVQELLNIASEDKVLIVVGPNPATFKNGSIWSTDAAWGEELAEHRLHLLFNALNVHPANIERFFVYNINDLSFNPKEYSKHHIFFLGSPISNKILETFYWNHTHEDWVKFKDQYTFEKDKTSLIIKDNKNLIDEKKLVDKTSKTPQGTPDLQQMDIVDHFLVARLPNPYSEGNHYKCILSCGTSTFGTCYGAVILTCRDSIVKILNLSEGKNFSLVGKVEMKGIFNPDNDRASMIYFNSEKLLNEETLLKTSLKSVKVWDPPENISDFDSDFNREIVEHLLEKNGMVNGKRK